METLSERVTVLEGKTAEHLQMLDDIREAIGGLEARMDRRLQAFEERMIQRFDQVDRRFEEIDRRFEQVDRRFEQVDQRFEQVDRRFEEIDQKFEQVDRRFEQADRRFDLMERRFERSDTRADSLDAKMTRQFHWLVGLYIMTLIGTMGGLGGVIAALLRQ